MNKQVQKIVVDFKSGFGVKDKLTGNWFNPSKALAKKLLPQFNSGQEYTVELEESKGKDGKVYTNIVAIVGAVAPAIVAPVFKDTPVAKAIAPSVAINKDERILVQGLTQALLQSPVMAMVEGKNLIPFVETNVVALVEMVRRLAK